MKIGRQYLRAPLNSKIICSQENEIFLGKALNISEGGILLEAPNSLQHNKASLFLLLKVPDLPELSRLSHKNILGMNKTSVKKRVVRAQALLMRFVPQPGDTARFGIRVKFNEDDQKSVIQFYITQFSKNIIFLLGLFEGRNIQGDKTQMIRKSSLILGYDPYLPLGRLRLKCLHDYHSLESL